MYKRKENFVNAVISKFHYYFAKQKDNEDKFIIQVIVPYRIFEYINTHPEIGYEGQLNKLHGDKIYIDIILSPVIDNDHPYIEDTLFKDFEKKNACTMMYVERNSIPWS